LAIGLDGGRHLAHRLAWLIMFDCWPAGQIDHINGVRHDNRISNLRVVTASENRQNLAKVRGKTSLWIGVSWSKAKKRWSADIRINGKHKNLGTFLSETDARDAYLAAKRHAHRLQPFVRENAHGTAA